MTSIEIVVQQHTEEAGLVWPKRNYLFNQPHLDLSDITDLDSRLSANLDGLRLAGDVGWRVCCDELKWESPGEIFPVAILALESADDEKIKFAIASAKQSYQHSRPLVSAIGWSAPQIAQDFISKILFSADPFLRRVGLAASAIRREAIANALKHGLAGEDKLLRTRAMFAVGELGRSDLVPLLRCSYVAKAAKLALGAAWSGAILGCDRSLAHLQKIIERASPLSERALNVLFARLPSARAKIWLNSFVSRYSVMPQHNDVRMSENERRMRLAVQAVGVIGTIESIDWLLEMMKIPALARVAGESFTFVTGLSLDEQPFEAEWPDGFVSGPTDDPDDDVVEMDPDENLPWPNVREIQNWWHKHRHEFQSDMRYFLGRPVTEKWLIQVLHDGFQRQRARAAIELAILRPGSVLFNVAAPAKRQKQLLARLK